MDLGLELAPPGSARNGNAVLSVCISAPPFRKGCRAHREAALSCACQGQELMLVAELWHSLGCRVPALTAEQGDLGKGTPGPTDLC